MLNNRVVIKIGSQVLIEGNAISLGFMRALAREVKGLIQKGYKPVLVLSGAVATGKNSLKAASKHTQAAFGQLELITKIHEVFAASQLQTALVLLTKDDINHRVRYEALKETLIELTENGIVPLINENDATTAAGNEFFDNDQLATIIALLIHPKVLLLMTNVDGVYSDNPHTNSKAELITEIDNINLEIIHLSKGKGLTGRGGMDGKLRAARIATVVGIPTYIIAGNPAFISDIVIKKKKQGTYCHARGHDITEFSERERWILSGFNSGASIQLDPGATTAVLGRKSLLAVGVKKLFGSFSERECVELLDDNLDTVALGLTSISSDELERTLKRTEKPYGIEVVHANNLRLII